MRGAWAHLRARLRLLAGDPLGLGMLLFGGLTTLLLWPGAGRAGLGPPPFDDVMLLMWLWLWPVMVSGPVGDMNRLALARRTGGPIQAMPMLPVGPRTRIGVEVAIVLAFTLVVRLLALVPWAPWRELLTLLAGYPEGASFVARFGVHTVAGAVLMLPMLVVWSTPASSHEELWTRPVLYCALLWGALELRWLNEPLGCIAVGLGLAVLALATARLRWRLPVRRRGRAPAASRSRPALAPDAMLRRDAWRMPLRRSGVLSAVLLAIGVGTVVLDATLGLPRIVSLLALNLSFGLLLGFVALMPMGSPQVMAGLSGKPGYALGDFERAWAPLPVRRESVRRVVYGHGLVGGALLWGAIVGVVLLSNWIATGAPSLQNRDGRSLAWLLLPLVALVPCLATMLTGAAAGDRRRAFAGAFAMILFLPLIEVAHQLGPTWAPVAVASVLMLVGGLPGLRLLRPRPVPG